MTEAIKQWIADQTAATYPDYQGPHEAVKSMVIECQKSCTNGLTKGIEIAQGFAEWLDELYMQEEKGQWYAFGTLPDEPCALLTTSQLLEKYIQSLDK